MTAIRLAQFTNNISRAKDMVGLGQSYESMTNGVVDASDMYRASLVQAVAALDHYIHGVVLDLAVDILLGRRIAGRGEKVALPLKGVQDIVVASSTAEREQRARTLLAERLRRETFQRAEAISVGLSLVGISGIWTVSFPPPIKDAKQELNLIVSRRNQIVHQGDADPLQSGTPNPISCQDALDAAETINSIVITLDSLVN